MTDPGRAPADPSRLRPAGPPAGTGAPARLDSPAGRRRSLRLGVRGVGLAVVVLGLLIGVAAITVGGDAEEGARREPQLGSSIVQVDPDQPEPTRVEPGGRDQLLLLAALVTGSGVLVVGAASSARRARSRAPAPARRPR